MLMTFMAAVGASIVPVDGEMRIAFHLVLRRSKPESLGAVYAAQIVILWSSCVHV